MALEDLLREAAAKGLTHLSLHPVQSEDGKMTYWRCSATPSTVHKYVQTANTDPAKAMEIVLEALPRAPKRAPPKYDLVTEAVEVTAAVNDEPPLVSDAAHDEAMRMQGLPASDEWEKYK